MKKQIIYMVCATALLSSCHIYKAYDRPDTIETSGIYRDPVSATDTLAATDTANMGNLPWKEVFRDPKLQALIEEGLANNVDMQAAVLRVEEAKVLLTSARLSFLPSINFAPQGTITSIGNSEYVKAYSTPLAASWEVDLFGKLLNASRGQKASYLQSQYSRQAVRSLSSFDPTGSFRLSMRSMCAASFFSSRVSFYYDGKESARGITRLSQILKKVIGNLRNRQIAFKKYT